jgi:hypothetical protein
MAKGSALAVIAQFFAEIPKVMEDKGYYDWVSARIKR